MGEKKRNITWRKNTADPYVALAAGVLEDAWHELEVRLLLQLIEEEVRWLKRQNDDHQQRKENPTEAAKRLTIKARPPAQLPPATIKMLMRTGFQYSQQDQTWSAWDDVATRVVADVMADQGQLFG